jgi:hypothetical protein
MNMNSEVSATLGRMIVSRQGLNMITTGWMTSNMVMEKIDPLRNECFLFAVATLARAGRSSNFYRLYLPVVAKLDGKQNSLGS